MQYWTNSPLNSGRIQLLRRSCALPKPNQLVKVKTRCWKASAAASSLLCAMTLPTLPYLTLWVWAPVADADPRRIKCDNTLILHRTLVSSLQPTYQGGTCINHCYLYPLHRLLLNISFSHSFKHTYLLLSFLLFFPTWTSQWKSPFNAATPL